MTAGPDAPRCAYQGAPGAFSEEAALRFAPGFAPEPYPTFAAALEAVRSGACARAAIPLRNTLAGEVPGVAELLAGSGLRELGEHDLPIRLHLLAAEGTTRAAVRTAESHPVALKQCRSRLVALGLDAVERFDTAGAAREVAAARDPIRAAVAGPRALELYPLVLLLADIQDDEANTTRFAVLSR